MEVNDHESIQINMAAARYPAGNFKVPNMGLSMASAFNNHFTKIQLSANSAAPADENLQADINFTLLNFIKTRIYDSTQFNIPLMTTE